MRSLNSKIFFIGNPSNISGGAEKYFQLLFSDFKNYLLSSKIPNHYSLVFLNLFPISIFIRALFAKNSLFIFNVSVLFQFVPLLLIASIFRKNTAILPHVVASPSLMNPRFLLIRRFLYHLNSFLPSNIICISSGNRQQLSSLPFVSTDKLITIYNYVNIQPRKFSRISDLSFPLSIALIGRLQNRQKGQYDLIKANLEFFRNSDLVLSLYGDGPDYKDLKKLIIKSCLTKKVVLHGHVPTNNIFVSDFFSIVLCYSYWEGLPLNLLEAYSYCKIVIGRDIPGVREIVYPPFMFSSDQHLRDLLLSLPDLLMDNSVYMGYLSFVNCVVSRYCKSNAMSDLMNYVASNGFA